MRNFTFTIICLLLIVGLLLAGCSSNDEKFPRRQGDYPKGMPIGFNESMNITNEERQAMMDERQQQMMDACDEKNEGDVCQFPAIMGSEMEGTCKYQDEEMVCMIDRPMRER